MVVFLEEKMVGLPARHFDVGVESGGVGHCEVRGLQSPEPIALGRPGTFIRDRRP